MTARRERHTATLLSSGKVLVAGGYYGAELASAELYDPAIGTWMATGGFVGFNGARANHTATLLPNDNVLAAGGLRNGGFVGSAQLYSPASGLWMATGNLAIAGRRSHTATLLTNGKVLIAGGVDGEIPTQPNLASAELYDPATGMWTATGSLASPRGDHTATLLPNGKVLVAGGYGNSSNGVVATASVELYDPASGTWTATGSLAEAHAQHTATLLSSGKVLVVGGDNGGSFIGSGEIYDPATGTWTMTGSLTTARLEHTATLLPTGKVLVAGGHGNTAYFSSAELYDPASGTWRIVGSLVKARGLHTATLLPDGKVLFAGGYNGASDTGSSAELYTPNFGGGVDFNGDRQPDAVIYNPSIATSKIGFLQGNTWSATATGPGIPDGWTLVKARDFTKDGKADLIIFRPASGEVSLWTMNGITRTSATRLAPLPDGWQIAAVADLNADGNQDLVLFNPSTRGQAVWFYKDTTLLSYSYVAQGGTRLTIPAGFTIAAAADFNQDRMPDLLLYHPTTRQTIAWYLDGTTLLSQAAGPTLAQGGALASVADFNGDGRPDLLVLETATRQLHFGFLNGLTVSGYPSVVNANGTRYAVPSGYQLIAP